MVYENMSLDNRKGVNHDDRVDNIWNPLFNCVWGVNIEKVMTAQRERKRGNLHGGSKISFLKMKIF